MLFVTDGVTAIKTTYENPYVTLNFKMLKISIV